MPLTSLPFDQWEPSDAREALDDNIGVFFDENRDYIDGDHWRGGDGWIGPAPDPTEVGARDVMNIIEMAFVSRNVIDEITSRHANGVIGKPPRWRFAPRRFLRPGETPNDTELNEIAQIEGWITEWWDKRATAAVFYAAVKNALWAERGPIRLMIPDGLLIERNGLLGTEVTKGDIQAALDLIWPEAPDPEVATVWTEQRTKAEVGIVITQDQYTGLETIHLCYRDGEGTVQRLIGEDGEEAMSVLNLGGRLLVNEICRKRLITEQLIQGQKALNLALSMIPRTVVTAGFLERAILNAQMPGEWKDITDASGRKVGTKFIPAPPTFGASSTNYIAPIIVEEDNGTGGSRTVMSNADIKWREPSDPKMAVAAKVAHYQDMLEEANQAHILIQSDATPSGNSREQARAEYEGSLNTTKPHADKVGRWFLETLLAFAEQLAGIPGKYTTKYRALFECNVDSGPLTPDEKRQIIEAAKDGFRSKQSAMEMIGVEDVDAEDAQIKAEAANDPIGKMEKIANVFKVLSDAGFPIAVAVKMLGIPEEFHAEIISEVQKEKEQAQQNELAKIEAQGKARQVAKPAAPSAA